MLNAFGPPTPRLVAAEIARLDPVGHHRAHEICRMIAMKPFTGEDAILTAAATLAAALLPLRVADHKGHEVELAGALVEAILDNLEKRKIIPPRSRP